jgi:RHS repeat-associated protein
MSDYYPFGMLMPGRHLSDNSGHTTSATLTVLVPSIVPGTYVGYPTLAPSSYVGHALGTSGGTYLLLNTSITGGGAVYHVGPITPGIAQSIYITAGGGTDAYRASITTGVTTPVSVIIPTSGSTPPLNFTPTSTYVDILIDNHPPIPYPSNHINIYGFTTTAITFVPTTVVSQISSDNEYKYGFNGKHKDNEWAGVGNHIDYGFRGYDPRIARFNSVDPLTKKYPMLTPYQFASNTPIAAIDLDGLEAVVVVTGSVNGYGSASAKKGKYHMYTVNVYENLTLDQYNEALLSGTLPVPTATFLLSRDAWRKPGRSDRSTLRYGTDNETPPGVYYLTYNEGGYGSKRYKYKISDTKDGDEINGPDGTREGVRWHQWSPWDAEGCMTTASGKDTKPVDDIAEYIPSLKTDNDVRLIVEKRKVVYDEKKKIWVGIGTGRTTPPPVDPSLNGCPDLN